MKMSPLVLAAAALTSTPLGAIADQPTSFYELGPVSARAVPASVNDYLVIPFNPFDIGDFTRPGEVLTIKWFRFELPATIDGDRYLDIDTRLTTLTGDQFAGLSLVLYDNQGNLVANDDRDGSFPEGFSAGLSFGSSAFRTPPATPALRGQDGAALPEGTYWLALAAGSASSTIAEPTNWGLSTTAALPLGIPVVPNTYFVSMTVATGNTALLPVPVNDNCANPIVIGEDRGTNFSIPAWEGTNLGAINDGFISCYVARFPELVPKDIWFSYVPSRSGYAEVVATADTGFDPILARYAGCFEAPIDCASAPPVGVQGPVRLSFPVTAGEPVLLGLSMRAGDVGGLQLSIRLLPEPCTFVVPDGAVEESEAELTCFEANNDGCNTQPPAYDRITPGQTITGRLYNAQNARDTDWFEFDLARPSRVTLTLNAQFPSGAEILGERFIPTGCSAPVVLTVINNRYGDLCGTLTGSVELPAGTHRLVVANSFFDGLGCTPGYDQYWVRLDASPIGTVCPADLAGGASGGGDGTVDGTDFIAFINSFSVGDVAVDAVADIVGAGSDGQSPDGTIDGSDFIAFINAFAVGC